MAATLFELRSNEAGSTLTIRPDRDEPEDEYEREGDYWIAELTCGALRGSVRFYDLRIDGVRQFFEGLAADWRGWEGERTWASLEGDIELAASHNKLGRVTVVVRLRNEQWSGVSRWSAAADLVVDAGALDRIAREAAVLT
jgi:hypothetical protein